MSKFILINNTVLAMVLWVLQSLSPEQFMKVQVIIR